MQEKNLSSLLKASSLLELWNNMRKQNLKVISLRKSGCSEKECHKPRIDIQRFEVK
jgi:hypothetical protein